MQWHKHDISLFIELNGQTNKYEAFLLFNPKYFLLVYAS